jgi:hypothetical protein
MALFTGLVMFCGVLCNSLGAAEPSFDTIIQALDAQVVPVTRIPDVLRQWREPRHPEFREGRTAWRLFNSFTEVLKGQLDRLPRRTQALHGLMDSVCGLTGRAILQAEDAEILATTAA